MKKKQVISAAVTWFAALLPAIAGTALYLISGGNRAFADWYCRNIYPLLVGIFGRVFGWLPFSVNEFGIYLLILLGILFLVRDITRLVKRHAARGFLLRWLRFAVICGGSLWLIFMLGCGINYNRTTFAGEYGMDLSGGTAEDLYYLCEIITEKANSLKDSVSRDENGIMILSGDVRAQAVAAMKKLSDDYPSLKGFYPKPKPVFFSEFLSHEHITGIHSPYTQEAQYNRLVTPYNIPHTVCHELGHLKGYMREDEANFVGFLACIHSDDADFRYSGYVLGYIYAGNALYGADYDKWYEVTSRISPVISKDLAENSRYWSQFQTKLATIKEAANDSYLKFHHQEDGVKSYGRVVDLMMSFFREEIEIRKAAASLKIFSYKSELYANSIQ